MFETTLAPIRLRLLASGVTKLGIFGSWARGESRPDSDVDVFVVFQPDRKNYDNFFQVYDALEEVFQKKIDLVTEDALSPYLAPKILREVQYVDLGV